MEHYPACEMDEIISKVYQRLNTTAYETSVLKQKTGLCYCHSRQAWGDQFMGVTPSMVVDRIALAMTLVMDMRTKQHKLDLDFAPIEKRALEFLHGEKEREKKGKVVRVDFQARRRLID